MKLAYILVWPPTMKVAGIDRMANACVRMIQAGVSPEDAAFTCGARLIRFT